MPCWFTWCPVGWLVDGCGARAVSRKTPIHFIDIDNDIQRAIVDGKGGFFFVIFGIENE